MLHNFLTSINFSRLNSFSVVACRQVTGYLAIYSHNAECAAIRWSTQLCGGAENDGHENAGHVSGV